MSTARTLAGELLILLAADDDRSEGQISRQSLTAALLAELALEDRIEVGAKMDPVITVVEGAEPMGEHILDEALRMLRKCDGHRVSELLEHRKADFTERITEDLVADGAITVRKGFLGEPWAKSDRAAAEAILARLADALDSPKKAEQRDAVLVRLLAGRQAASSLLLPHLEKYDEDKLQSRISKLTGPKIIDEHIIRLLDASWSAERL